MGKYQILEHTADKGLAVEAESLPDLFETAARGLFRLMIDPTATRLRSRSPLSCTRPTSKR
jgi:SHS2 domain-containing protein